MIGDTSAVKKVYEQINCEEMREKNGTVSVDNDKIIIKVR